MSNNILTCPRCGGICTLKPAGERIGGFSAGKAAAGAFLLGPIGLAAGALGKKKTLYICEKCGYSIERYVNYYDLRRSFIHNTNVDN